MIDSKGFLITYMYIIKKRIFKEAKSGCQQLAFAFKYSNYKCIFSIFSAVPVIKWC